MLKTIFKTKPNLVDTNFRTLNIADELYGMISDSSEEFKLFLKDQLLRASSSVVLNLVEGNARRTSKDKRRFYNYAYASAKEVKAGLRLAGLCDKKVYELCDRVCASTFKLQRAFS